MNSPPPRRPQVFDADDPNVRPSTDDPQTTSEINLDDNGNGIGADEQNTLDAPKLGTSDTSDRQQPRTPSPSSRQFSLFGLFVSAVLALVSIAAGLWFASFVSVAVARDDWIGWFAKGLAGLIVLLIAVFVLREVFGLIRLARLGTLRRDAEAALAEQDIQAEKRVVGRIKRLARGRPAYRWALADFRDRERHHTKAGERLALADTILLRDADKESRRVIYESARRVAVVTAVVPIAFIAMMFVLYENLRMVRRLAATYGGRPGILGGWRLLIRVIFHIAATGAIALTDDLFGQFLGQDVIRRLSARLGEGAFNGALTARLGIVAIELTRPCPYINAKPLRARHVISELFPEFSVSGLVNRKKPPEQQDEML